MREPFAPFDQDHSALRSEFIETVVGGILFGFGEIEIGMEERRSPPVGMYPDK